ncbi:MAG: helix-turn-helix transcriptional regulator [Clostridia bacterium]|nr:helix-turn-helix transcriptional regulator [Clostridia bacterium]
MNDDCTDIYLDYNRAIIYAKYNNPEPHKHMAAHIILSFNEPFKIIVDGKCYEEYGICIPSNCMHKIVDYKKPLLVFLYEETTGIAKQIKSVKIISEHITKEIFEKYMLMAKQTKNINESFMALNEFVANKLEFKVNQYKIDDERIIRAMNYIWNNLGGNLKIKDVASLQNLSESRFSHLFKEQTGIPFASYVKINRLIRAYYDIFSGNDITYSAMNAGFASPSHLAKTSKEIFGIRAIELRNKVKVHYVKNM